MTRRNSSGVDVDERANTEVNATLTHTSIGAELVLDLGRGRLTASWSAMSTLIVSACPPAALDLPGGRRPARFAAGEQGDVVARRGERLGGGPPDAAGWLR